MTRCLLTLLALACLLPAMARKPYPADEGAAREYCDSTAIQKIEGIWEFPEDDTRVLICGSTDSQADYDIVMLYSPDCRLTPGTKIGTVSESAQPDTYQLSICRKLVKGVLTDPDKCVATLKDNGASLLFKPRKLQLSLRTMSLLPNFWKRLRWNIKLQDTEIQDGMVRIYPRPYESKNIRKIYL